MTTTTAEPSTSCANCGEAEELKAKLKACLACRLVKYCDREAHRPQHKKACKNRAAEIHDDALFRPPPKGDDCPICFLLLPNTGMVRGKTFMPCCGKVICNGCRHAHNLQIQSNGSIPTCPFCRAEIPSVKEGMNMLRKRVDANDANAVTQLGKMHAGGDEEYNIKTDMGEAIKLLHRAAELGSALAYSSLAYIYDKGDGASEDKTKAIEYFEKAAMGGCARSRSDLDY